MARNALNEVCVKTSKKYSITVSKKKILKRWTAPKLTDPLGCRILNPRAGFNQHKIYSIHLHSHHQKTGLGLASFLQNIPNSSYEQAPGRHCEGCFQAKQEIWFEICNSGSTVAGKERARTRGAFARKWLHSTKTPTNFRTADPHLHCL